MKFYILTFIVNPDSESPVINRKIVRDEALARKIFLETERLIPSDWHDSKPFSKKAIKNLKAKGLTQLDSKFYSADGDPRFSDVQITLETFEEPDEVYNAKITKLKEASKKPKRVIDPDKPVKLKKDKKTSDEIVDAIIEDIDRTNKEYENDLF